MSDTDVDQNVFIPDQIRRQIARADELQRQLLGQTEDEPASGEAPDRPSTSGSEEGDPSLSPPTSGSDSDQPDLPLDLPEQQTPRPDWEQRYRTLQGKYDSEMGQMRGQLSALERLLATMQTAPTPAPAPAPAPAGDEGKGRGRRPAYSPDDLELYGEDLLNAASRAAEARYADEIADLRGQVSNLSAGVEQDRVFRALDADPELAGRWRGLNTDPDFITWLQAQDAFSGVSRNTMLQHAYQNGDAMRTGRFFKAYMAEHTAPLSSAMLPQTATSPTRNGGYGNGAAAGGPRLEEMAAPGRAAGSGSGNGAPQDRLWSRPQIKQFYLDRTHGKFRGREAEADRLEQDLLRAEQEGRLV